MQVSEGSSRSVGVYTLNEPNHSKSVNSECRHPPYMYEYIYVYIYAALRRITQKEFERVGARFPLCIHTYTHTHYRMDFFSFLFSNAMYTNKLAHDVCARFIADEIFSGSFPARPRRILMCVFTEFLCVSQTIPLWFPVKKKRIKK